MNLKTDYSVLKSIVAINLDVSIWSARRKLTPEDLGDIKLPPEELASLGSKKICDPQEMRVFGKLKSRAVGALTKSGIRFLGGWAIAENNVAELVKELEEIRKDFLVAKNNFMSHYDQSVKDWIKHKPDWEKIIANSVVSAQYVSQRMNFSWQVFKVEAPIANTDSSKKTVEAGLQNEVGNLGVTLFDEIAKSAKEAWRHSYLGKTEITRKALSPLKNIYKKLQDLSFIEPRVGPVASLINTALSKIPKKGVINGMELLMLQGLLALLGDTQALTNYGQEIIDGRSSQSILDCLIQNNSSTPKRTTRVKQSSASQAIAVPAMQLQLDSMGLW